MALGNRKRAAFGVLRCLVCGEECDRQPRGLAYGFPRHCGAIMTVITPSQLAEERRQFDLAEQEAEHARAEGHHV